MTAQEPSEQFLPKDPVDLPRPSLDLPTDLPKEIPAHAEDGKTREDYEPYENQDQVRTLLSWNAPGRPYRKRSRDFYISSLMIALLVEIILFLFAQYLLMLVVVSFVFVSFALAAVPPHDFNYKISTEGVRVEDHFYLWEELYDFYFKRKNTVEVLHIRTRAFIPGELTLTLGEMQRQHVSQVMSPYLPYREYVKPTFMEKSGDWLEKNFPLERTRRTA